VAVVGKDFPNAHTDFFARAHRSAGLERARAGTSAGRALLGRIRRRARRWRRPQTCSPSCRPKLPEPLSRREWLFFSAHLAGASADVHRAGGAQPRLVAMDTMTLIEPSRAALARCFAKVRPPGHQRRRGAASSRRVPICKRAGAPDRSRGPKNIKRSAATRARACFHEQGCFAAPAYPLKRSSIPPGAGDTSPAAYGYLAKSRDISPQSGSPGHVLRLGDGVVLRRGALSLDRLRALTPARNRRPLPAPSAT